jgi:hypothetical protein
LDSFTQKLEERVNAHIQKHKTTWMFTYEYNLRCFWTHWW